MEKMGMHLLSENRNPNIFLPKKSIRAMGTVTISVHIIPAVTAECFPLKSPLALLFAISLETVTGMPLDAAVRNTAKTVRHI